MFLNFVSSKWFNIYQGVHIFKVQTEEDLEGGIIEGWERLERNIMGLTDFTYQACQAVTQAKEMALGNRQDW